MYGVNSIDQKTSVATTVDKKWPNTLCGYSLQKWTVFFHLLKFRQAVCLVLSKRYEGMNACSMSEAQTSRGLRASVFANTNC